MFSRCVCFFLVALLAVARADDQVRSTQEELRRRNLYFGDIDGRQSPELEEAIKRFQHRKGLSPSGRQDPDTLRSLGVSPRSPNEPKPKELDWPAEPILKSDEKVNVAEEATELAQTTGIAPETVVPNVKLVPIASQDLQHKLRVAARPHAAPPAVASAEPAQENLSDAASAIDFVKRYLRAAQRGDLRGELCFYADRVDYYSNGPVDRRVIEHSLRKYYARWPHRSYHLDRVVGYAVQARTAQITIAFTNTFTLYSHGARVHGTTENRIVVNAATSSPRIVAIRESRVHH